MKISICIFFSLFLPLFLKAQKIDTRNNDIIHPKSKIAVAWNVLSILDPELPTIQLGAVIKIKSKLITEIDFGIPIHFNNGEYDTVPNWFTHFKIKNSIMYLTEKKHFYIGGTLFYTDVHRFSKNGRFSENSVTYGYSSAEWKRKIFGYGFKIEKFSKIANHLTLAFSTILGQRFVNSKIYTQTINTNPILAKDWFNYTERVGKFSTFHLEVGFKVLYIF
jgi:hypothetical protein